MQARSLPARTGLAWLLATFALYRRNPPLLTSATMVYLMIVLGLSFVPLLGSFVVPVLLPSLNLIVANTCRLIDNGQQPSNELIGVGVREQRQPLFRLGVFQLGASVLLFLLASLVESALGDGTPKTEIEDIAAMLGRMFLLAAPLLLAFWFAPLLAGWNRIPPGKALFFSLVACWRNLGAFVVYLLGIVVVAVLLPGLVMTLASLAAPGVLGGLSFVLRTALIVILTPILMAGPYVSYRDVFLPPAAPQ